jgi:hypothetical protein
MKPLSVAVALALGFSGVALVPSSIAWAQSFEIGRGGVRVDPYGDDRYERRRARRWERDDDDDCRTIIERRRNRWGEMEERRREVCR